VRDNAPNAAGRNMNYVVFTIGLGVVGSTPDERFLRMLLRLDSQQLGVHWLASCPQVRREAAEAAPFDF
jgi:hypothetical protein